MRFLHTGMIMSAYALLTYLRAKGIQRIEEYLLPLRTGYLPIIDAIEDAARG